MPLLLPSKLFPWMIQHGIFPKISTDLVANYWRHLEAVGSPLRDMSPNHDHIPMYVWGDGAQYTESGESMMVFSCGIVIDPKRTNIFPLFLCREVTWHDQRKKVVNLFLLDEGYGYLKIDLVLIMHWSSKSIQYSMCLPLEGTVSWWCNHVCLPGPSPLAACLLNQKLVIWWVPGHILGT